jgi:excisionase family DNA binding protein
MTLQDHAEEMNALLLTVAQAAKRLNIGRTHTYRAIHEGKIGHVRLGGKILVPVAEIDRIVNEGVKGDS